MSAWKRTAKPSWARPCGEHRRRIGAFDLVVGHAGENDLFAEIEIRGDQRSVALGWVRVGRRYDVAIKRAKAKAEAMARKAGLAVPRG